VTFLRRRPEVLLPLALLVFLWIYGATLGLTDDEAYYWVLAQKPQLSYAFHPPAIAWLIGAFQWALGWLFGTHSPALVRLPAALCSAGVLALGMEWMRLGGVPRERLARGGATLLAFAGMFAASWMMVPDLPLLFGFMLLFVGVWRECADRGGRGSLAMIAGGMALSLLSKYSAVLAGGSAGLCLLFWAPRPRRWKAVAAVVLGGALALVPILIWNSQNGWGSILYQIRDRHEGGHLDLLRYGRFWALQALLAGPPLLLYSGWAIARFVRGERARSLEFVLVWAVPAALVFCGQPLVAEFKPHWAFVVWLPFALLFGLEHAKGEWLGLGRSQIAYGLTVGAAALVLCQLPVITWALHAMRGATPDPRMDVSNDMYGWSELSRFLRTDPRARAYASLPVIGSRYQTASQAAFALDDVARARVTLLPRDEKALEEWPTLGVADGTGPGWPRLLKPVLFVTDHRYTARPEFAQASCSPLSRIQTERAGVSGRWIDLWLCEPSRTLKP
jgi:4-amino-4-deoxy-L-arabinose transferase-like glycosyltransferase